jgi:hypothetical protein
LLAVVMEGTIALIPDSLLPECGEVSALVAPEGAAQFRCW